ncbi:MAG TPA: copper resistance protein CopC [Longimicrobiales bacterium]|nr:copper resistance protein CopC [Longimicrobiales bacterium]
MMRRPATPRGWMMLLFATLLLMPVSAHAHIELEDSSPGPDEVLATLPSHLRLLFSARIEGRYTSVTLTAPDGRSVALGDVVFTSGSDREIRLRLPSLTQPPGTYVVRWRTAGADGHVLEGSYSFVLASDSAALAPVQDTAAGSAPGAAAMGPAADDPHGHHAEAEPVSGAQDAIGRGLHFVALLLLLGGVTFRVVLLPRLALASATAGVLQRRTWRVIAGAAVLLAVAAVLRLWFQSISLHGSERAWSTELLSIMLTDTSWGRAWLLQAVLFALLGMAIAWARPGRDRAAAVIAIIAVLGLATIPALSGHAAGASGLGRLIIVNDALHVAGAGAWLGTLAVLMLAAIPAILRIEADGAGAAARAIDTFSPLALAGGAIVMLSGVINAVAHLSALSQLWTTGYGRVLLVKLLFVGGVAVAGFVNWRMVRPRLRAAGGVRRLRLAAGTELLFAVLVLTATAVLTGQQRP